MQHCLHFGTTLPSHLHTAGLTAGMSTGAKASTAASLSPFLLLLICMCLVLFCSLVVSLNNVYIFWPFFFFFKEKKTCLDYKKKGGKLHLTKLSS